MKFESITHYFFKWNSDLLPNTFKMTNGIRIHYLPTSFVISINEILIYL